ncbi:MAG: exosortase A [Proteobacteria bacterium]|nr:exosortase A [Pseudomonadota bacterium]
MSAIPAELRAASPWRTPLVAWLALVALLLLAYRDTVEVMVGIWYRSETFAHCFLVLPLTLWMVWRQRAHLAALAPRPEPRWLLAMAALALAWLAAGLVVVNAAAQFAFVALLILSVPAMFGWPVARALLFPLLFLFFAVPFGEFVVPTMMEWTADVTVGALQATGIPVYREGQNFVIPSGNWSVIDECSGVRYLMASFMVGSLFAYLNYRSYLRRAVFMLVALALPVVANWVRAYMVVMLAHLSGNRIAVGVDHILYGWVFFGIIIFLMFMVGARWAQPDAPPPASAGRPAGLATGWGRRGAWTLALAAAVLVLLPPWTLAALQRAEGSAAPARLALPAAWPSGWSDAGAALPEFTPQFAEPSVLATGVYRAAAGTVGVQLAYFRGQNEERRLVSSSNMLVGMRDRRWGIPTVGSRVLTVDGREVALRSADVLDRDQGFGARHRLQVWRLYWIDGRYVGGDIEAKLAQALARARGHGDDGALVLLYAEGDPQDAGRTLQAFADANLGALSSVLERTRRAR